jgi:hypothetical protein
MRLKFLSPQPLARTAHKRKTRKLSPPGRTANRYACRIPRKKDWLPGLDVDVEDSKNLARNWVKGSLDTPLS